MSVSQKKMGGRPLATYENLWSRGFDAAFLPMQKLLLADFHWDYSEWKTNYRSESAEEASSSAFMMATQNPKSKQVASPRVESLASFLPDLDIPWIFIGNHPSNWDGFLMRQIHQQLRGNAPVYSVMLENELKKLPFFRKIGALGIEPGNHRLTLKVLRFLKHLRQQDSRFSLSFFPQGEVTPSTHIPLGFHRGIEAFVNALAPVKVIPVAFHLDFEKGMRPTAHALLGKPLHIESECSKILSVADLENCVSQVVTSLLQERRAINTQSPIHTEHPDPRDANDPFPLTKTFVWNT
jgi:1-acyl-sn-glycerol-3-phosphate acyltransferase